MAIKMRQIQNESKEVYKKNKMENVCALLIENSKIWNLSIAYYRTILSLNVVNFDISHSKYFLFEIVQFHSEKVCLNEKNFFLRYKVFRFVYRKTKKTLKC